MQRFISIEKCSQHIDESKHYSIWGKEKNVCVTVYMYLKNSLDTCISDLFANPVSSNLK